MERNKLDSIICKMPVYYILLRDQFAKEKSRGLYDKSREVEVLRGSLWFSDDKTNDVQPSAKSIKLSAINDKEGVVTVLICASNEIARLTEEQCELLKPVPACSERYKVFQDKSWLSEIIQIKENTTVYVLKVESSSERLVGRVRHRGAVPDLPGIYFGVELSAVGNYEMPDFDFGASKFRFR